MMRSLYSGVSGLRNHQTRMDVIGNNIANVNTVGFKASRTIFQDIYSQNVKSASAPGDTTGGTNPQQIGLGVQLSTIDTLFTRSAPSMTNNALDLMIENDGFFVVRNGTEEFYTRAGNFALDKNGDIVMGGNGFYVMGFKPTYTQGADAVDSKATAVTSSVNPGLPPKTNQVTASISSDVGATNNDCIYKIDVIDATTREIRITRTGNGATATSTMTLPAPGAAAVSFKAMELTIELKADYTIADLDGHTFTTDNSGVDKKPMGAPITTFSTELAKINVDSMINLGSITVDKNGNVSGVTRADGYMIDPESGDKVEVKAEQRVVLGRVSIATFENQQALEKVGSNMYKSTSNTGDAHYSAAGTLGAGAINPGALEMSNVDMSQEFTDMIVTQRGFQANSRIITVSDTLLEELVNLKR